MWYVSFQLSYCSYFFYSFYFLILILIDLETGTCFFFSFSYLTLLRSFERDLLDFFLFLINHLLLVEVFLTLRITSRSPPRLPLLYTTRTIRLTYHSLGLLTASGFLIYDFGAENQLTLYTFSLTFLIQNSSIHGPTLDKVLWGSWSQESNSFILES